MFIHASMFLIPFIIASCYLGVVHGPTAPAQTCRLWAPHQTCRIKICIFVKILGWLVYTQKHLWNFTNNPWDSHFCQGGGQGNDFYKAAQMISRASKDEIYQIEYALVLSLQKSVMFTGVWRGGMLSLVTDHLRNLNWSKKDGAGQCGCSQPILPSSGKLTPNICPILDGSVAPF